MVSTEKKRKKKQPAFLFHLLLLESLFVFLLKAVVDTSLMCLQYFLGTKWCGILLEDLSSKRGREGERLLWDIYSAENKIRFLIELPNNVDEATPQKFTIKCFVSTPILPIPLLLISRIELTFNWIIAITLHSSRLNCARLSLSHKRVCVTVLLRSKNPKIQKGR